MFDEDNLDMLSEEELLNLRYELQDMRNRYYYDEKYSKEEAELRQYDDACRKVTKLINGWA